ncbi:MAG: helix-turn-helix domain-containing protein [Acidobacteria bacterium]|nr:helix-turn-helix domain-containing protein [Acidobacteriota bacterium]MCA1639423.1 helix-turn-helix domain-containing protein [Acidobacteriota bacterium]
MNLLSTSEAAKILRVTPIRVRQLIREGKIRAKQVGRDYVIEESSLDSVKTYGKAGRPVKEIENKNGNQKNGAGQTPKSFAEVAAKYIGSIKDGLPTDLSTNKKYLKDLGKKSAEKKALRNRIKNSKND